MPAYRVTTFKDLTVSAPTGSHAIRFVDAQGGVLQEEPFTPEYEKLVVCQG
jgi:hypothetical protein